MGNIGLSNINIDVNNDGNGIVCGSGNGFGNAGRYDAPVYINMNKNFLGNGAGIWQSWNIHIYNCGYGFGHGSSNNIGDGLSDSNGKGFGYGFGDGSGDSDGYGYCHEYK